ncbi:hypothetical protein ACEWPB_28905 (plasmid) [Priestia megaterium]|uniref:hypothetical protein n=1 Tax=Priestia megaterium TaxID=1404 RepID=UPI0035CB0544
MSTFQHRSGSPLIQQDEISLLRQVESPLPHTEKEIATLMNLLTSADQPIESIMIGHGRDTASKKAANTLAKWWEMSGGIDGTGGYVLDVVDWPEEAASWLRHATRFTHGNPDAWVVTGPLVGWIQMSRRLYKDTEWNPKKTFGFASLADHCVVKFAGGIILEGMRGALSDGGTWKIINGQLSTHSSTMHEDTL